MKQLKNFHAFRIRFIGPTNYNPARVSINSLRFEQRIIVPTHPNNNTVGDALQVLKEKGFNIIGQAEERGKGTILFSDTFKPLK